MKKLFTISWPDSVRIHRGCQSQDQWVVVDTTFSQNYGFAFASGYDLKHEITPQLISFNFFAYTATYRKKNALLITYSAEITHIYKQFTSSFKFGLSTDVLPSVLLGSFPKNITINSGDVSCNSCHSNIGLFRRNYRDGE